jgi:alpha-glucuronidase
VTNIVPFEAASGERAVHIITASRRGTASLRYPGMSASGMIVQYFDEDDGVSRFRVFVGGRLVDEWKADDTLPTKLPDTHSSSRRTIRGLALKTGDEIRIEAVADGGENAVVDYVEFIGTNSSSSSRVRKMKSSADPLPR